MVVVEIMVALTLVTDQVWQGQAQYLRPVFSHDVKQDILSSASDPIPTDKFEHSSNLDHGGNVWLFWNVSANNITFELHAKTRGYVGFGLSTDGNMYPSDVVVSWVNSDGTVQFKDCHTTGHYAPIIDHNQDWHLLSGIENDFGTVITFTRKLQTCDNKDTPITGSTVKVIYSYHPDDPASFKYLPWHGITRRGAKSLRLLSSQARQERKIPTDAFYLDVVSNKFHVPAADTRYQCNLHKLPPLRKKHHMIRYEPIIQKENQLYVHHMNVFLCPDATDADVGKNYDCFGNVPDHLLTCTELVAGWAVGSDEFNLPDNVGYPLGYTDSPQILRLQIHYNNPSLKTDIIDSSGIRLILTPTLRAHDAGAMFMGVGLHDMHFIPPREKSFLSSGQCSAECTRMAFPKEGIKIFALYQHAHLLGTSVKTRHIRGNHEFKPIADDHHYDYAYQEILVLREEREIKQGDTLVVECTYDSRNKSKPTVGGLSVHKEMCVSLVFYYPKITMSECFSDPNYKEVAKTPEDALKLFYHWNWDDENVRLQFQNLANNSIHVAYCDIQSHNKYFIHEKPIPVPSNRYKDPGLRCNRNQN